MEYAAKGVDALREFANVLIAQAKLKQPAGITAIKSASPRKCVIRENFVPAGIAASHDDNCATCMYVLTGVDFFQGSDMHLKEAHQA